MRCGCLVTLIGLTLASTPLRADDAAPALPRWIWTSQRGDADQLQFTRSIQLAAAPLQAELQVAGDFCTVEVRINDALVLELEDYSPIAHIDVTPWLAAGENAIRIDAIASDGPSAVALSLELTFADARRERFITDEHWQQVASRPRPVALLGGVDPGLWGADARSIEISPFDNYEQWRQALGAAAGSERYWTAPGFEIELVRAAAEDEGSWVALAFDPQGRVTIAREDRGLLRMAFDHPGGDVTTVEAIDDSLLECRGLLYVDDDLYANANNSKGTYVLKTGADGRLAAPQLLREFSGGVGHGRNQLARGPDGRIYSICGDSVDLPAGLPDRTSPLRHGGRPHPALEGFVVALDPQSDQWELSSTGTRTPFGIAFNRDGEAFTYDADAEFDMGSRGTAPRGCCTSSPARTTVGALSPASGLPTIPTAPTTHSPSSTSAKAPHRRRLRHDSGFRRAIAGAVHSRLGVRPRAGGPSAAARRLRRLRRDLPAGSAAQRLRDRLRTGRCDVPRHRRPQNEVRPVPRPLDRSAGFPRAPHSR